jgi:cytochrome c553
VRRVLGWLAVAALAAGLVVLSGVLPLTASSGHWPATAWLLDFAKVRSVTTHSLPIATPPLDDPSLVQLGMRTYEHGCQRCHGRPGSWPLPAVAAQMTPHPPSLAAQIGRWRPRELFYIVRHGIKFTGMPAWPAAGRDDEVWAVVAYLRTLPALAARGQGGEPLDAASAVAARGDHPVDRAAEAPVFGAGRPPVRELYRARCAWCHGPNGEGRREARIPRLAGQRRGYLALALRGYADGSRPSGAMRAEAAALTPGEMDDLATWLSTAAGWPAPVALAPAAHVLVTAGDPNRGVPACASCHGNRGDARNDDYPLLQGLPAAYLATQLDLFAHGRRHGSRYAEVMRAVAERLSPEQRALAARAYTSERSTP